MSLDLNLLVVFDAVMAERNLRKAAERLHRSQPAVSQSVARLRHLFADRLFEKIPTGVRPTPRAEALWLEIRDPLKALADTVTGGEFDPATVRGEVPIGLSDDIHSLALPGLVDRLRVEAPRLSCRAVEVDHRNVWHEIETGGVDVAVTVAPAPPRGLAASVLFEQRFVVLARSDMRAPTTLGHYLRATHVAVGFTGRERGYTDERLAAMGEERRVIAWTPRFSMIADLVRRTGAIATMPEPIARRDAARYGLHVARVPFELQPAPVRLCWHERRRADPANAWLRERLADVVRREVAFVDADDA